MCTTTCGDSVIAGAEACDDGDAVGGDGCSATCVIEPGWSCTGTPSVCTTACGDGTIAGSEVCDDGNSAADDGCSATCTIEPGWTCTGQPSDCDEICGDGLIVGVEACDDGAITPGDGCSATCTIEPGWSCTGEPSVCTPDCGDGVVLGSEDCDDGNTTADDGCSAACAVEPGWSCEDDQPSTCTIVCGDGMLTGAEGDPERCDDGNTAAGDGCDAICNVEAGWICSGEPSRCEALSVAGGGCAAGGGGPQGLGLILLVGVLGMGRRRRLLSLTGGALVASLVATASPAAAQMVDVGATDYPAERFQLSMDRDGILGVESARAPGHLVVDLGIWLGYANDPLTLRLGDDRDRLASLVNNRLGGDLVASVGIGDRIELGLTAPLILSQDQDLGMLMSTESLSSFGFGDLRFTPKFALLRGGVDVAVALGLTVPTSGENYRGDGGLTATPQVLVGKSSDKLRYGGSLGWRIREGKQVFDLDINDELLLNLGAGYRATSKLEVLTSLAFATAAADPFGSYNRNHAELQGGAGFDVNTGMRLFGALGAGMSEGYGTPDWRMLVGLWFGAGNPRGGAKPPVIVEVEKVAVVDPDPDKDGILAPTDQCPTEAETTNQYQEEDGCPDEVPDTDGDGKNDQTDTCPTDPEDADSFEDEDGCPDPDNDKDSVLDPADRCPVEAGVVENGGCPDTDRDADTVVDRLDNCPDEPGTAAFNGCKEKLLVTLTGGGIELLEIVYFKSDKAVIDRRSYRLLTNAATVIAAHPQINRVVIEGHTDNANDEAYNKDLSQRRAEAVVAFLIEKGVDPAKLTAIGYGEEKPVADNNTRKGRRANRRVEFKIE